jgi:hypothetical protein
MSRISVQVSQTMLGFRFQSKGEIWDDLQRRARTILAIILKEHAETMFGFLHAQVTISKSCTDLGAPTYIVKCIIAAKQEQPVGSRWSLLLMILLVQHIAEHGSSQSVGESVISGWFTTAYSVAQTGRDSNECRELGVYLEIEQYLRIMSKKPLPPCAVVL